MNMNKALRFGFSAALLTMMASALALGTMTTALVSAAIGDWEGKIDARGSSLRVIVHISQVADGKLTGSLDSPDQGTTGLCNRKHWKQLRRQDDPRQHGG